MRADFQIVHLAISSPNFLDIQLPCMHVKGVKLSVYLSHSKNICQNQSRHLDILDGKNHQKIWKFLALKEWTEGQLRMGVDMICNVGGGLDDHCARSAQKISTQLLKMPQKCTFGGEILLIW